MSFDAPQLGPKKKKEEENKDNISFTFHKQKISSLDKEYQDKREFLHEDHEDRLLDGNIIKYQRGVEYWKNELKVRHTPLPIGEVKNIIQRNKKGLELSIDRTLIFIQNTFLAAPSPETTKRQLAYLDVVFFSDKLAKKFEKIPSLSKVYQEQALLEAIFGKKATNHFTERIAEYLQQHPSFVDKKFVIEFAQERADVFEKQELALNEKKEKLEKDFLTRLTVLKDTFQLDLNLKIIEQKLQKVHLVCVDPLEATLEKIGGRYDSDENCIEISFFNTEEHIEHIYSHEALHAIAGQTVIKETPVDVGDPDEDYPPDFDVAKEGLLFRRSHDPHGRYGKKPHMGKASFHWLNEAVTEDMTVELLSQDKDIYRKQRDILNLLLTESKGKIQKKDFYQAYFEEYGSDSMEKIPHWKGLHRVIQNVYGPTYLQRLDGFIKRVGVDIALEHLKKFGVRSI